MKKVNLVLVFHIHQPVGNLTSVFEKAVDEVYIPLLEMLDRFPDTPFAVSVSGPIWEYTERKRPRFNELVLKLHNRSQLELISTPFYQPFIGAIADDDCKIQIEMSNDYLEDNFDCKPHGFWIPERMWSADLPMKIARADLEYTFIDDRLIRHSLPNNITQSIYSTEHLGFRTFIFPVDTHLRDLIPFLEVSETIAYLRENGIDGGIFVYADDAEKFGLWPGTDNWKWRDGWLEEFINTANENSDWLNIVKPSDLLDSADIVGPVYPRDGSYWDFERWALKSEDIDAVMNEIAGLGENYDDFVRGGDQRSYYANTPPIGWMHKRMLWASRHLNMRINELENDDQEMVDRFLLRSQCNDAYWSGIFGGYNLPFLRSEVWRNILHTEHEIGYAHNQPVQTDLDCDGFDEVLLSTPSTGLWITPQHGGAIREIDLVEGGINILDSVALYDHFAVESILPHDAELQDTGIELDRSIHSFFDHPYEIVQIEVASELEKNFASGRAMQLKLAADANFEIEDRNYSIRIEKTIVLNNDQSAFKIMYNIENNGQDLNFILAIHNFISLSHTHKSKAYFKTPEVSLSRILPGETRFVDKTGLYEYHDRVNGLLMTCASRANSIAFSPQMNIFESSNAIEEEIDSVRTVNFYKIDLREGQKYTTETKWHFKYTNHEPSVVQPGLFD